MPLKVTNKGGENVAKKSIIAKQNRKPKFKVKSILAVNVWASTSVIRKFKLCRICFRELAYKGQIPGVKKSSW